MTIGNLIHVKLFCIKKSLLFRDRQDAQPTAGADKDGPIQAVVTSGGAEDSKARRETRPCTSQSRRRNVVPELALHNAEDFMRSAFCDAEVLDELAGTSHKIG